MNPTFFEIGMGTIMVAVIGCALRVVFEIPGGCLGKAHDADAGARRR